MRLKTIIVLFLILTTGALIISCGEEEEKKPSLEEILGEDFFEEDSAKARKERQKTERQVQVQGGQQNPQAMQPAEMPPDAQVSPELQKTYQKALQQLDGGKIDEGIKLLNKAIEINSNIPDLYQTRGVAKLRQNKHDAALKDFSKAISLNPNFMQAYQMRSNIYLQKNQMKNAVQDLIQIARLTPPEPKQQKSMAYSRIGSMSIQMSDFDTARKYFGEALKADPNNVEAITGMGYIYMQTSQFEKAMESFNKAIKLYPSNGPAYFFRASLRFAMGDSTGACADWKKAKEYKYPQAAQMLEKNCK